jgi:hypothetical protein
MAAFEGPLVLGTKSPPRNDRPTIPASLYAQDPSAFPAAVFSPEDFEKYRKVPTIPENCGKPEASNLKCEVKAGNQTQDIDLK